MAHYLVTGGAGFIGNNIVSKLVDQGERVRVLDNSLQVSAPIWIALHRRLKSLRGISEVITLFKKPSVALTLSYTKQRCPLFRALFATRSQQMK